MILFTETSGHPLQHREEYTEDDFKSVPILAMVELPCTNSGMDEEFNFLLRGNVIQVVIISNWRLCIFLLRKIHVQLK